MTAGRSPDRVRDAGALARTCRRQLEVIREPVRQPFACPVCGSFETEVILEIASVPVHCHLLCETRAQALTAPRAPMLLTACYHCKHLFNAAFDPDRMHYQGRYENSLHCSPLFQRYASRLAKRLVESYRLYGKTIMEIGCGQAEFLRLLCRQGGNFGIGFDPACEARSEVWGPNTGLRLIRDSYTDQYSVYRADFVCCRHVLEHLHQPRTLLSLLRRAVDGSPDGILFFEVPSLAFMLRQPSVWDVLYEHCCYYSETSLSSLFRASGFKPLRVRETFGGRFLCIEARLEPRSPANAAARKSAKPYPNTASLDAGLREFGRRYREETACWRDKVQRLVGSGAKVVLWGAGSKGVMFLNAVSAGNGLELAVDLNARKHGMYVAGSGHRIVGPATLRHYRPDVIIVANPAYRSEIEGLLRNMGLVCTLLPLR